MKRADLLEALERVAPGLAQKESIEQGDCYVFLGDRVVTFNDEVAVSFPIDIGFEGAVNAKKLYELVKRMKTKEITLTPSKEELKIKGGKGKGGIRLQESIALPIDEFKGEKEWVPCPHGFPKALRFVLFTVSQEEHLGVCTGVHVSDTFMESTDNFRVTRKYYEDLEMPFEDFVLPSGSAKHLTNYDLGEIYVDGSWAHFRALDNTEISARIYNEEYPNLDRFIDTKGGACIALPDNFLELVARAGVFSEMDESQPLEKVKVSLTDDKITVRGRNEQGWFEEAASTEYDGADIDFISSPKHLAEMYAVTPNLRIIDDRIVFEKEDDFVYITAMIQEDD